MGKKHHVLHCQTGHIGLRLGKENLVHNRDLLREVSRSVMHVLGKDIEVVVLNDGRRLVTPEGLENFLGLLNSPLEPADREELDAFVREVTGK